VVTGGSGPSDAFLFRGYRRPDGKVGTRNYVAVLPTVACANDVAERIAETHPAARPLLHHQGCGQLQPDLRLIERTLIGLACNGNVGAVLLVSLGCEGVNVERIAEAITATGKPLVRVNIQEMGSSSRAIRRGREACRSLGEDCRRSRRSRCGPEGLVVGIKCGASDMTSGIASNPAVGAMVDSLVVRGGTVIVGETTEFLGAEHLLVRRAATPAVGRAIRRITREMQRRALAAGGDMLGGQPSHGNIQGGITTIEEKSLGAVSKAGSGTVHGVLDYAERPPGPGLYIMDGPGFEPQVLTGLAAGGAQVLVFGTGRGAPQGFPLTPVVKVSGNPATCRHLRTHIDVDVSAIVTQGRAVATAGREVAAAVRAAADGRLTRAEHLGYDRTVDIYTRGPSV
jgi:altronate dehydratase large subunit